SPPAAAERRPTPGAYPPKQVDSLSAHASTSPAVPHVQPKGARKSSHEARAAQPQSCGHGTSSGESTRPSVSWKSQTQLPQTPGSDAHPASDGPSAHDGSPPGQLSQTVPSPRCLGAQPPQKPASSVIGAVELMCAKSV